MIRKLLTFLVIASLLSFIAFPILGEVKTVELVIADDMPPASMKDNGDEYHGFNVEAFLAICKEVGFEPKVTYQPWVRAQETVSKGNNLIIMGLGRTPDRENNYSWVSMVYSTDWAFASINGKAYDMESAKSLKSVLVPSGTPMHAMLTKAGFTNLSAVPENATNAKKLATGRGEAWISTIIGAKWIWKRAGYTQKLTFGPAVWKNEQWIAMSPDSDPSTIAALKKGLDAIKAKGLFNKILDRYYK